MAKITRQVDINYVATGLENIIKSFEQLDPSKLSNKAQKATADITNTAKTMLDQINLAIKQGDMSEEMARKYEKMFQSFIGADFDRQFKAILQGVGGDFDAAFSGMTAKAAKLTEELANIESQITVEQKGFEVQDDKVDFATQTKKNEVAAKALQQVLKENSDIEQTNLTRAKNKAATYVNLEQNQQRVNEALKEMSSKQKENLESFIKEGKITEANAANVELLVKKMEGNLSVQEVQQRLKAKSLVDDKLEIELKNKKTQLIELENKKIQTTNELKKAMDPVKMAKEEVDAQKQVNEAQQSYNKNQQAVVSILSTVSGSIEEVNKRQQEKQIALRSSTAETERNTNAVKASGNTFTKAANQVFNYGLAFSLLRRIYRETLRTIRDLDKALTEMAIVTTMNRNQAFQLADTMADLARQTGFTTTEIAKLSTIYFRQGRTLSEVIELTTVAAKAARIAGISAAESANFLTSAVNAFQISADQALAVSDKFAAIAAQSASSYEELAIGLSKFAAQANVAGVSIDFAMGLLAKGVETTREAPETIGTALKTVIARMRELTDLGKTFEDGMDISRVETALRQVGVALRDEQGQFRDLELVLTELGQRWSTLNRNQQASIAVALAGTRQQSRLIAIMQDFDRTLELVNVSQESAGATNAQQVEFMQSLEAATVQLQTAWQDFIRTIGETETIIGVVKGLTFVIDSVVAGLNAIGVSGKNATLTLIILMATLKSLSIVKSIYAAIAVKAGLSTTAFSFAVVKATFTTAGLKKAVLALWVALGPFGIALIAITAGAAALAFALGRANTAADRANKKFQENTSILEANNYEINRSLRNVNKLREEIEQLSRLSFLTPDQAEELDTLKEKLAETVGEEFIARLQDGSVAWEETLIKLTEFENQQIEKLIKNRKELLDLTLASLRAEQTAARRVLVRNEEGRLVSSIEVQPAGTLTREQRQNFSNVFIGEFQDMFEKDITPEIEIQYRRFLENANLSVDEIDLLGKDLQKFVRENVAPIIFEIENFNKLIEDAGTELGERSDAFNKNIEKISNEDVKEALKKQFADLNFILETGIDVDLLESVGITKSSEIQDAFKIFRTEIGTSLSSISARALELESLGFESGAALRMAFSEASRATEDAEARVWLYNQAFQQTMLESVQGLDTLASRIQRIDQVQKDWIEGTISYQDLFEFFDSSADLFKSMDDVERFLSGESMQADAIIAKVEAQRDLVVDLYHAWNVYNDETATAEDRQQALTDIALLASLTEYRGTLTSLTEEQHKFNASLAEYNLMSDLGIDTSELSARLLQEQAVSTTISTQKIQDRLSSLRGSFEQVRENLELDGSFDDYFQIINGQIIPVFENLEGLTAGALTYIDEVLESYQSTLNEAFDDFKAIRDQALKIEKDTLDKQQKVYEDYFAALDRLEAQRERKASRQDLVAQLSRLEGATDERSRRRALEIRRELNQLDADQARDTQQQARDSLLQGFEDRYVELETRWAEAAQEFISNMSSVGEDSGNAFVTSIKNSGLGHELAKNFDIKEMGKEFDSFVTKMKTMFEDIDLPPIIIKTEDPDPDPDSDPDLTSRSQKVQELFEERQSRFKGPSWWVEFQKSANRNIDMGWAERQATARGFSKGGMVDFEGLAMLHGSRSAPEAVLNPIQTQMFIGLRDALENLSFNSSNGGSVNIENISISTASLNNNQDFKRAGESLADAFKHAIQRKGVTINTNKT